MRNQYRLGIDAGGTFTDFILADRDGVLTVRGGRDQPHARPAN